MLLQLDDLRGELNEFKASISKCELPSRSAAHKCCCLLYQTGGQLLVFAHASHNMPCLPFAVAAVSRVASRSGSRRASHVASADHSDDEHGAPLPARNRCGA